MIKIKYEYFFVVNCSYLFIILASSCLSCGLRSWGDRCVVVLSRSELGSPKCLSLVWCSCKALLGLKIYFNRHTQTKKIYLYFLPCGSDEMCRSTLCIFLTRILCLLEYKSLQRLWVLFYEYFNFLSGFQRNVENILWLKQDASTVTISETTGLSVRLSFSLLGIKVETSLYRHFGKHKPRIHSPVLISLSLSFPVLCCFPTVIDKTW